MTKLSQHLTVNRRVLERLIELADPDDSDVVLEPGCGDGRLTELLAERGCRVVAVEIDPVLAAEARRRLSRWENVDVVTADVLKLNPGDYTMVVGNPPY
ncbi:MAG: methyltransferase domain-containing protein, partial [Aigarchaeota archaeon]|nr:methyltransferase domain-containing protein [Candidatus Calditenuaceae archaeon]